MNQPTQPTPTPLVNVHALTFIETASHGYLRAPFDELLKLPADALKKISRYSFLDLDRRLAYLEEDCDLAAFIKAAQLSPDDWERVPRDYKEDLNLHAAAFIEFIAAHVKPSDRLTISADRKGLAAALAFVSAAMSDDPMRPALNGIAFEIEKGKALAVLIATDGRRLHAYSFKLTSAAPCNLSAIISPPAVEALTSARGALNLKKALKARIAAEQIALTFERSPQLADWLAPAWIEIGADRFRNETAHRFPNWRAVIPKNRQLIAPLDVSLLGAALDAHERACADFIADCINLSAPRIQSAYENGGSAERAKREKDVEREAKRLLRDTDLALNLPIAIIEPTRYQYLALPKLRKLEAKLNNDSLTLTSAETFNPDAHLNLRAEYVQHAVEACALLTPPPAADIELDPIKRTPTLAPIQIGKASMLQSPDNGFILIMPMRLIA